MGAHPGTRMALALAWAFLSVGLVVGLDPISLNGLDPRCGSDVLPPGSTTCSVDGLVVPGINQTYTVNIGRSLVKYGLLFTVRVTKGISDMSVMDPKGKVISSRWLRTPGKGAYNELFVRVQPSEVVAGMYSINLRAQKSMASPAPFWLRVEMFYGDALLNAEESAALLNIMNKCCKPPYDFPDLCEVILPAAVGPTPTLELCQTGNFICNSKGQLVKASLGFAGFKCPLPVAELATFTALQTLTLDYNDFQGSTLDNLAKAVTDAGGLTHLFARGAYLTGTLPCALVEEHPLQALYVGYNDLGSGLPECYLKSGSLRELSITGAGLTGPLPNVIPVDSNLQVLRLGNGCPISPAGTRQSDVEWAACGKGFTGPIPSSLSSAQQLMILDLSFNTQLTGTLPELLDSIQQLDVSFCSLSGPLPVAFPTSATVFDITNNSFTGPVPDTRGSPELWGLLAGGNKLDGPLPPTFGAASNSLRVLDLGDNQLGSQLAATAWEEMTQIQHISLRGNQLAGTVPTSLAKLQRLQHLDLGDNKLTGNLDAFAAAIPLLSAAAGPGVKLPDQTGHKRMLLQATKPANATTVAADGLVTSGSAFPAPAAGGAAASPAPAGAAAAPPADASQRNGSDTTTVLEHMPELVAGLPAGGNAYLQLIASNNQLTGTVPPAFGNMMMFANTSTAGLPHMKFQLADNKLSGEFPMWLLLDAVRCYGDSGCQQVDVDLDGNELWCPLASSLKATGMDWTARAVRDATTSFTCRLPDTDSPVVMGDYLSSTDNYLTSLPAAGSSGSTAAAAAAPALARRMDARPDLWLIFVVAHAVVGGALLVGAGIAWLVRRRREAVNGVYEKNTIPIEVLRTQPLAF